MRIGSVQLKNNLLLAPIAGYCDLAFRLVVRSVTGRFPGALPDAGVALTCTDLLCPQAILRETDKTLWLASTHPDDQPMCMQLYGRHPEIMAEAAQWAQAHGASIIDINMGCPVDKVTKKNGGSKLLCEPDVADAVVKAVVKAVTLPVTVKIRLGWDDSQIITRTLPPHFADLGVAAITVHGRTTEQKFRGQARLEGIAQVVEAVKQNHTNVKVIGNGDVTQPVHARHMLDATGCDGVMIGRGALGQPWLFRDTAHYLASRELPTPVSQWDRARLVIEHMGNLIRFRGQRVALNTMRQRLAKYSPHLQPWPNLRRMAHDARCVNELRDMLEAGPVFTNDRQVKQAMQLGQEDVPISA